MGLITTSPLEREKRVLAPIPHRYDLIITDYALLNCAFFLAALVTYGFQDFDLGSSHNLVLLLVVNLTWTGMAIVNEIYRWYERIRIEDQLVKVFKTLIGLMAIVILVHYTFFSEPLDTRFFFTTFGLAFSLISVGRVANRLREGSDYKSFNYAVVGGAQENVDQLFQAFDYCFPGSAKAMGRFGIDPVEGLSDLGDFSDLKSYLKSDPDISKLIYFYSNLTVEQEREIFDLCTAQFIEVEVAPRVTTIFPRSHKGHRLGDMTMLTLKEEPLHRLRNKTVKRAFDIVFSLAVVLFIFPIMMPIVAILIYLEDPGPIFFRQERSGYRNEIFKMWKFRSMRVNDNADTKQATKGDNRITRIGAFLRKTSLDEFPQFINVLFGQMSVVGPRPHMVSHTEQYARIIQPYMIRHKVKPGVTGLAQIKGYRGPTEEVEKMEKRVKYDVWYLENWTILMDVRCIFMTVVNAIRGEENAH